uniref:Uncharacterized protein n=1 Tax=Lygus hesperus TaxID=30085 RepID=A0A0A9W2Q4_LYGHE
MASRVPLVKSCCCGCSLETGSKIIGFIELIGCVFIFIFQMVSTVQLAKSDKEIPHKDLIIAASMYLDLTSLFEIILAIYLLYGIYYERPNYVRVWVLIQCAFLVVSIVSDILFITFSFTVETFDSDYIPEELILTVLQAYSVLVVHSYYISVRGREALYHV